MGRNVVVCCDGTWNVPDEQRHGAAQPTNVAKLALAVAPTAGSEAQLKFYEPGVGTRRGERLTGGALGYGISRNICSGYRFLVRHYQPGDQLFMFGFSRGAYTARSLAGLIRNCGILRRENEGLIDSAYAFYRDRTDRTHPSSIASRLFRESYAHPDVPIHFIGVWDTVGALGIPNDLPGWHGVANRTHWWQRLWGFHDTQLSSQVTHAIHALSIDEQRAAFRPTLWQQGENPPAEQSLKQVWFSGCHSEVGGGTDDNALSDIALLWMADEAALAGLAFDAYQPGRGWPEVKIAQTAPDFAGRLLDSRRSFYRLEGPYHRLAQLPDAGQAGQKISATAAERFEKQIDGYAPKGFERYLAALGDPVDVAPAAATSGVLV